MRKVLIIDDEKPTLAMFELFLEAYGFEVLTALKGEEGIALFEAEKPSNRVHGYQNAGDGWI